MILRYYTCKYLIGTCINIGRCVINVTSAKSLAVHPFTGSVTVSVYVPALSTVGVAVLAPETIFPPLLATQANIAPSVVDDPLNDIEVTTHVSTLSAPALTLGGVLIQRYQCKIARRTSIYRICYCQCVRPGFIYCRCGCVGA